MYRTGAAEAASRCVVRNCRLAEKSLYRGTNLQDDILKGVGGFLYFIGLFVTLCTGHWDKLRAGLLYVNLLRSLTVRHLLTRRCAYVAIANSSKTGSKQL